MTWHTVTVTADQLARVLGDIRHAGGSITHSIPSEIGYTIVYTSLGR